MPTNINDLKPVDIEDIVLGEMSIPLIKGDTGETGATGLGIESITTNLSNEDSGSNIVTVKMTDGTTKTFPIKNGSKGSKGDTGKQGEQGKQGAPGEKGDPLKFEDLTEEQKLELKGEKGDKGDTYDDTELKEKISLLEKNMLSGHAEGESITVKDSADYFASIGIEGNHWQEVKEARYPLDPNQLTNGFINSSTGALEGISSSYPDAVYTQLIELKKNDLLVISNHNNKRIRRYSTTGAYIESLTLTEYTAPEDCKVRILFLEAINENTEIKINYDSPSIDHPSDVHAVGDNIQLFDGEKEVGSVLANGTNYQNAACWRSVNYIPVKPNMTYTLGIENIAVTSTVGRLIFLDEDNNASTIPTNNIEINSSELKFTTASNCYYIRFFYTSASVPIETRIKLVVGTRVGAYSKYGEGSIEIKKCNKNILKITSETKEVVRGDVSIKIHDDGVITLNGTASATTYPDLLWGINTNVINHNTCKYYFPKELSNIVFSKKVISGTVDNKFSIACVFNDDSSKTVGVTNEKMIEKASGDLVGINRCFMTIKAGITFDNYSFYLQLEEGNEATDIVEHKEENYVMPIQKPMYSVDEFVEISKIKYQQHYSRTVVFNGSENWVWSNNTNDYIGFVLEYNVDSNGILYCDKFRARKITEINNIDLEGIALKNNNSGFYIRIPKSKLPAVTLAGFKQLLSENNITVIFSALEPELLPCTEEQSEILNKLENTKTYKNVTHIDSDSRAILSLDYKKDLETVINNLTALTLESGV